MTQPHGEFHCDPQSVKTQQKRRSLAPRLTRAVNHVYSQPVVFLVSGFFSFAKSLLKILERFMTSSAIQETGELFLRQAHPRRGGWLYKPPSDSISESSRLWLKRCAFDRQEFFFPRNSRGNRWLAERAHRLTWLETHTGELAIFCMLQCGLDGS